MLDVGAGGGFIVNEGAVTVAAGATLRVTGGANGFAQSAAAATTDVRGTLVAVHGITNSAGTVSGDVTSAGVVAGGDPYNPIGKLTISGNLTLTGGGEYLDTIGPVGNSLLSVGGFAQLDGALAISFFNFSASSLAVGDRFEIMDFGSAKGDFTAFDFLGQACSSGGADAWICPRELAFAEQFIASSALDLVVTHAEVPEPGTWALVTLGFVGLASRSALRRAAGVTGRALVETGPASSLNSSGFQSLLGTERCLLASAAMRLASTANPSAPTRPSSMQRSTTLSNRRRSASLSRKRPCRFLEKVE